MSDKKQADCTQCPGCAEAAPAEGPQAEATETPRERADRLEAALAAKEDQYLRVLAEYDNFRKRSQKERESIYESTENRVFQAFFPVVDNLERGAAAPDANEGIKMIFNQMQEILEKYGISPVGEAGEPFDPQVHNAVRHEGEGDTSVIHMVLDKGYKRGERLLKPAMVITKSTD